LRGSDIAQAVSDLDNEASTSADDEEQTEDEEDPEI